MKEKHGVKKASFWKRLLAVVMDWLIISFPVIFIHLYFTFHGVTVPGDEIMRHFITVLFLIYSIISEALFQATIGKWVMGIRVIRVSGNGFGFNDAFRRNIWKVVSSIPFGYGYLRILAPHRMQTMHDEFAKCIVIEV